MNQALNDFIEENTKNNWQIPQEVPENLWATDWPYAPIIDTTHDFDEMIREMKNIDHLFVAHRDKDKVNSYGHEGWYSITLHGISHEKTEHFDRYGFNTEEEANYHWTEPCGLVPKTVSFIKSLPFSDYARIRIMRLSPGGHIMPHTDGKGRIFGPFNFALNNPENCVFVFKDYGVVPFKQGRGFMLDLGNVHAIRNDSDEYRYHIILHGTPYNNINQYVKESIKQL